MSHEARKLCGWVAGKAVPLSAAECVFECDANKFYCLLRVLFVGRGFLRSGRNLCRDFGANLLALAADHTHEFGAKPFWQIFYTRCRWKIVPCKDDN